MLQTSETGVRDTKTLYYLLDCSVDLKLPQKVYPMKKGKEMGQNVATFHFGPQKKLGTQDRVGV